MNILIAPNAFKNSMAADAVADAIREGLEQSHYKCTTTLFPIGDGGDGTAALLFKHLKGVLLQVTVQDPIGRKIKAAIGFTDKEQTAIIELADASGLRLLQKNEYDPLHATTFGTGELINHALDRKVKRIILCIGGSATVDGGAGILQALGVKFLDHQGRKLSDLPGSLPKLESIDSAGLQERFAKTEIVVLCDVENTMLGEKGSAPVFGPQKGASPEEVVQLQAGLTQLRDIVLKETGKDMALIKHGGAAGAVAAALHCFLGAKLVNGIDYFLDITDFDQALERSGLLITGEGSIDEQTLSGKGPFGVASRARKKSVSVIGLAGMVPLQPSPEMDKYFNVLLSIGNEPADIKTAMQHTRENLVRSAKLIGNLLSVNMI